MIIILPILPDVLIDPEPTMLDVKAVSTAVLPEEYIELTFNVVVAMVNDVEPKNTSLNQLPVVSVAIDEPLTK